MNPIVDDLGRAIPLGQELGKGGQGTVFVVPSDPTALVKLYHTPPTQLGEKLEAIIRLGGTHAKLRSVAALPTRVVRDARTNQVVGFLMPRLIDFQPIQLLYHPIMRLRHFPSAGWSFQVTAAANLAAAFDEVHKAGCLVADVNESNAFVNNRTAVVRLIDCDSFQVPRTGQPPFLCDVGKPHYTPPELQGNSLRGVTRTKNHDCFGLAVLLYQLLFVGRYPYSGIYRGTGDPSFDQLIAEYRFSQGPNAHTWGMSPPPHTPTFADIPPDIGKLFRRAFERGSQNNDRPTAEEWHSALKQLSRTVSTCKTDPGHQYWNGQARCVWFRLAQGGGPEYYFGVAGGGGTFAVDEARLRQVSQRLAAVAMPPEVALPQFTPERCTPQPLPPDLVPLRRTVEDARIRRSLELARRRDVAAQIVAAIAEREVEEVQKARRKFRRVFAELDAEVADAKVAVRREQSGRGLWTVLLMAGFALGVLTLPLTFVNRSVGWGSGIVTLVCGIGLVAYTIEGRNTAARRELAAARHRRTRADEELGDAIRLLRFQANEARDECERTTARVDRQASRPLEAAESRYRNRVKEIAAARSGALHATKERLGSLKSEWSIVIQSAASRHVELSSRISTAMSEVRALAAQYASECQLLAANAEVVSRTRYLRLNPLADAEILLIGAGRLQMLATKGITTAADVDRERIMAIYGFGPVLAGNLTEWRDDVLRQFRFDPTTDIPPNEKATLVARYRNRQHQLLTHMDECCSELERIAATRQEKLRDLERQLRTATTGVQQAEADQRLVADSLGNL